MFVCFCSPVRDSGAAWSGCNLKKSAAPSNALDLEAKFGAFVTRFQSEPSCSMTIDTDTLVSFIFPAKSAST